MCKCHLRSQVLYQQTMDDNDMHVERICHIFVGCYESPDVFKTQHQDASDGCKDG